MSHSDEEAPQAQSAVDAAEDALDNLRISLDGGERPSGVKAMVNGHRDNGTNGLSKAEHLENELRRTLEEKEALADQYRTLVSRLNTMKTTLGNKLRQDAVRGVFPATKHYLTLSLGRTGPEGTSYPTADGSK